MSRGGGAARDFSVFRYIVAATHGQIGILGAVRWHASGKCAGEHANMGIPAVRTMWRNWCRSKAARWGIFSLFNKVALMYFLSAVLVAACGGSVLKVLAVSTPIR